VVGLAAISFFRKKLVSAITQITEATVESPPRRVRLQRALESDWSDPDPAEDCCQLFRAAGFDPAGDFFSYDIDELRMSAWVHVAQRLYGVVYDHSEAGIFSDVVGLLEDGGSVTVTNAATGENMDEPPEHSKITDPSLESDQLIERAQAEIAGRPLRVLTAATFKRDFEAAYARVVDWRNARGGPSEAEIRRIADAMTETVDERAVEVAREGYADQASEQLSESCLDFFMAETLMSVAAWEKVRDVVVVVHERMSGKQVIAAFASFTDLPDRLAEEIFNLEPADSPPREFFRHLNLLLDEPVRYRLLGSAREPVAADVYSGMPPF
jgi:hypothetical protein